MRHALTVALTLIAAAGCVDDSSPDGINDPGLSGGKADGTELTECESGAIVAYLNEGTSSEDMITAGVHTRAAEALAAHRDGADQKFGTADDDLYDTIAEVDEVDFVGTAAVGQLHQAIAVRCVVTVDPFVEARDVNNPHIKFPAGSVAPTSYTSPNGNGFSLGGTEFWQKWTGGKSPTFNFSEGTDGGRLCMQASAIRFETIMKEPPAEVVQLDADTNWSGSFFNWNDDFSGPDAFGNGSTARLWAWRTGLIKWISQTNQDGTCFLPTRDMLVRAATACLATGASAAGEIQGCRS